MNPCNTKLRTDVTFHIVEGAKVFRMEGFYTKSTQNKQCLLKIYQRITKEAKFREKNDLKLGYIDFHAHRDNFITKRQS